MAAIHSNVTSDYIEWDEMLRVVRRLYKDGKYRLSLLIGLGSFVGLRISDLRTLTWADLLDSDTFTLTEKKTGKKRTIKVNQQFRPHIEDCYNALGITCKQQPCFISKKGTVFTTQRLNVLLKEVKKDYNMKVQHFSTHSLRKTFGRRVVEMAGDQAEMALIKLSEIFNHSSVAVTKRYLGLRQKELEQCYDMLEF
jgi:integrase